METPSYSLEDKPPKGFGYIYLITNSVNGKQYIGQTIQSIKQRWRKHRSKNGCINLYRAIHKYGSNAFSLKILGIFLEELLDEAEKAGIRDYKTISPNGYNLTEGGNRGGRPSEETRKKLSDSHRSKRKPLAESTKIKISQANKGRGLGRHPSEETKKKLSECRMGEKHWTNRKGFSAIHLAKLSESHKGKSIQQLQRKKISNSLKKHLMRKAIAEIASG